MIRKSRRRRPAAHLVETAIVFSLTMVLLIGMVVVAMGVFRYQQTAYLAREAARYAAVHGGQYGKDNAAAITAGTLPNVTSDYILKNVIQANAVDLDTSQLSATVNFNTSAGSFGWDDTTDNGSRWPFSQKTINGTTYSETNTVSVTVTYQWTPEWLLAGPITLSSTSVMPMCY